MRKHIFYNEGAILDIAGTVFFVLFFFFVFFLRTFNKRGGTGDCDGSGYPILSCHTWEVTEEFGAD